MLEAKVAFAFTIKLPDIVRLVAIAVPVRVGEADNTTLPVPVVGAADMAVPLPCKIPVTVVLNVMAGVDVGLATVPAKPLADTTDTDVTVPGLLVPLLAAVMRPLALTVMVALVNVPTLEFTVARVNASD